MSITEQHRDDRSGTSHPRGPAQAPAAIEVTALTRRYGDVVAVDHVDFRVRRGEVFAFLGPNGAGKSTTIRVLCTLEAPTSGTATVAGYDVVHRATAVRRHIGLVFQEQTLDEQLTARENLRFHAVLYGVPRREVPGRIDRVLELVGLTDRAGDLVSTFSGGMARRLEIARGMLHTPEVLFLDEPTVGLDPQTRALMWEDVLRMREEEGVTIFLTTHYMEEAEYADQIAIIDGGRLVADGSPAELRASLQADTVTLRTDPDGPALAALTAAGFTARRAPGGVVALVPDGEAAVPVLVSTVSGSGATVGGVHVHRPTLDDVFLATTGRDIRPQRADGVPMIARAHRARRR